MVKCIVFKNDNGGISVIHPTPEALELHGIEAIALKDVPAGKPYKIIDASDLPSRDTRDQWDVDETELTDGIGNELNSFDEVEE